MVVFIDTHREVYGVEPIYRVLPIAPSTYYEYEARQADSERVTPRTRRDELLKVLIGKVWIERLTRPMGCARYAII